MPELPLTMPKMSMTMEEGTMVAWLKEVGDPVRAGEPICEVATDKVDMEVESPFDGTLARIVAQPDEVLPVGETIAWITTEADDLLGGLFDEPAPEADAAPSAAAAPEPEAPAATVGEGGWIPSVPAARSLAAQRGVALADVTPTGAGGVVRVQDVEAAASGGSAGAPAATLEPAAAASTAPAAPAAAASTAPAAPVLEPSPASADSASPAPGTAAPVPDTAAAVTAPAGPAAPVRPSGPAAPPVSAVPAPAADAAATTDPNEARRRRTRQQVARVMTASAAVPQFTVFADLDLATLARVRKTELGGASWTALLVRAQALALAEHGALNGSWGDSGVVPNERVGIAFAIDSPSGLIAPVLLNPHEGTLADLVAEIREVVEQTRQGAVPLDRLSGGTSVFSNLGGFGVDSFNALLTPPQATALSVGAVKQRLVVFDDGSFGPRLGCTVGLTVDHRVADGADAARYLATLRRLMSDPRALL